jgi:hypothetical protein
MGLELGIIRERGRKGIVVLSCRCAAQRRILSDISLCELG